MRNALAISILILLVAASARGQMDYPVDIRVHPIGKTVAELPDGEDFSKPERAYATIHRRLVAGQDDWRAMSVSRMGTRLPKSTGKAPSPRAAQGWLGAKIVEVRVVSDTIAYVLAQWPQSGSFDVRTFELEGGRWLNAGNQQADDLKSAQRLVEIAASQRVAGAKWRKRLRLPADYLNGFVEYLKQSAQEPKELVLQRLAERKLVAIGEIAHRPTYWQLNTEIVQDPRFAQAAGTIYLELPASGQELADRFLAADKLDPAPVIDMLRDVGWSGMPDQAMLDFFSAVWNTNHQLPKDKRIRIVLADAPRPWKLIRESDDLKKFDSDRDQQMAKLILDDLKSHDSRNALFIVSYTRAAKDLKDPSDGSSLKTAGWMISQELGERFFAFVQHGPQISGSGAVYGRTARGLFDSAFKSVENKPTAFVLRQSPFGGEPFDPAVDLNCTGTFQDAFDGYIFLERPDDEWSSPLIDGFYTDELVKELDRRYRLIEGKGLVDGLGIDELSADSFVRWLNRTWGQPREWKDRLGSIDAWQRGSEEMPP